MTTSRPTTSPDAPTARVPLASDREIEEEEALAGLAIAGRAVEVGAIVLIGLLICPPLAILTFLVVVPLLAMALVLGLLAAVITAPYLIYHHFRSGHNGHLALLGHRLRHAARALVDLAPHRIVADVSRHTHTSGHR